MSDAIVTHADPAEPVHVAAAAPLMPFVSVIVPAFNDHERLQLCLDALARQTYPTEYYEIIVVDNGSAPTVNGSVRLPGNAMLMVEPSAGSYAARNCGLAAARGTIVGFTDSDCLPASDWIETAARSMASDPGLDFLAGRVDVTIPADRRTSGALYDQLFAFPQQQYVERDRFAATANVFVRRTVIETVGAFDAALQSGGDVEWGKRVHAAGYRQQYQDGLIVQHPARTSVRMLRLKTIRIASGLYAQAVSGRLRWIQLAGLFARMSVPSVSELLRIARTPSLRGAGDRARVAAIAVYLRYVFCAAVASFVLGVRRLDQRQTG